MSTMIIVIVIDRDNNMIALRGILVSSECVLSKNLNLLIFFLSQTIETTNEETEPEAQNSGNKSKCLKPYLN